MTKWLIEHEFGEDVTKLVKSCEKLGYEYKILSDSIYQDIDWASIYKPEDCVVFYGSIQMGALVQRKTQWIPGIYSTLENYRCVKYYPIFKDLMLNSTYAMMPYGELHRNKEWLYNHLGIDDAIFIRPDSGNKIFTGKLVLKENFEKDVDLFGFYQTPPDELCVIAEPRNVVAEWRFLIVNNKIAAATQYQPKMRECINMPDPWDVRAMHLCMEALKLSKGKYVPDGAWTLDVCRTNAGNYYLLEVGCFSCAGLYSMNTDAIVKQVSNKAEKDWIEAEVIKDL